MNKRLEEFLVEHKCDIFLHKVCAHFIHNLCQAHSQMTKVQEYQKAHTFIIYNLCLAHS